MKRNILILFGLLLLLINQAYAVCPLCTIVVGAGVGLSHWLGIDDVITGIWIGGLIVSLIIWTLNWLNSKNIRFKGRMITTSSAYYALTIIPLYSENIMGHPFNKLWGMDKLLLGIIIGSIAFYLMSIWYVFLKKRNNGRTYFPFQKVIMPVSILALLSGIFYLFIL